MNMLFADVIVPLNLPRPYTYRVSEELAETLMPGYRVAVPFGRRKIYTGLVLRVHEDPPPYSDVKSIISCLDEKPILKPAQLDLWKWMGSYYLCGLGPVMSAALPNVFKLQSETVIEKVNLELEEGADDPSLTLSDQAFLIYEALNIKETLSLDDCISIVDRKTVMPIVNELLELELARLKQNVEDEYRPEKDWFIELNLKSDAELEKAFEQVKQARKQSELLLYLLQKSRKNKRMLRKETLKEANCSLSIAKGLEEKGIVLMYEKEVDSLMHSNLDSIKSLQLDERQNQAMLEIKEGFADKKPVLLHGVTGSGKTAIYTQLIEECLKDGKDVLYILPEIGITTQIIQRLELLFPDNLLVYHSKFSANERARSWQHLLKPERGAKLIIGARSAIFCPIENPGLIIVDEEHDASFKQYDPAPRYQARDVAVWMRHYFDCQLLLGTATPSLESYFNVETDKYKLVSLLQRYADVPLPKIEIIDIKKAHKTKQMREMFSVALLDQMKLQLRSGKQIILFQNRRGFSPMISCERCSWTPQCQNCDISLTYHKAFEILRCHYCGFQEQLPKTCKACSSSQMNLQGFGTEKIEEVAKLHFPEARVKRMDLDTTRAKKAYGQILSKFANKEIDILIGTQMVTKGLDFDDVGLVAVLNADNMLNFPDFRAFERSFQTLVQVAGRAGRKDKQGLVLIQTFQEQHPVIQWVRDLNYKEVRSYLMKERKQFHYPPFSRLIEITLKHKNPQTVNQAAQQLTRLLKSALPELSILGPAIPGIYRLRNLYQKSILIKIVDRKHLNHYKSDVFKQCQRLETVAEYRSVRVNIDVDPN